MGNKIGWVDNLRAVACMMVVMIHATTYYVTTGMVVGEHNWDMANILNSLSRVGVPLFFMISGLLFFGERSANKKHFTRIACCIVFYSVIALIYIACFTRIGFWPSLYALLQKPVFYHLWFFYAIAVIYLLSPLICVKPVSGRYLAGVIVILAIIANPNTSKLTLGNVHLLPVNLYIVGDTFYYLLYALAGRAIGMMETERRGVSGLAALGFVLSVVLIINGTKKQLFINGNFADTFYIYSGPLVFVAAVSLLVWFKNVLPDPIGWLGVVSRHSLAIYGFHAIIVNLMRNQHWVFSSHPLLDIFWVFGVALGLSLLLSMGLQKLDTRRLVS
ncbi:surface polysaccharide O-acyltransferase-like enzyme [Serratia fonticola]|jgi:surface polysaccharide O-acyltransferase-like enzyme|uniref:O-acetyltransferase WecH n=1 Tax=Serratia fonticola TaxID=47917 RepID=A0A542BHS9_SERFO|nr:acyltransferase [Serratia fonticola]TQI78119.1 surface polysaccharide O-acyltransferase-like enzyme [Serratia fonticola]TQI94883.1 surface polysaccharide O-acyltransferase-like enzyme [Serratia fonticola]TVZ69381.1 surface polysaccharide O-acyltransferase-like enzyme [Serratia fonticola]